MRVLISGGLGFMGNALGVQLQAGGHDVRLMDVVENGPANRDYFSGSVLNPADCVEACRGVDTVVHAAAIHDAKRVAKNPLAAVAINVSGTINLFRAARKSGVRRFVFMSSAKVYGDPDSLPSAESDDLVPRETYALSKVAGEHHLRMTQADSGIQVVITRPFSVYGPGQNLGSGYVGMVLESLLGERRVELPGHRDFRRDFVHIDDATRLTAAAIDAESLPGVTIMNVGTGTSVSLGELAECASGIVGYELPIGFRTPGPETLTRSHASLETVDATFGYRPAFDLRAGLTNTIEWFMSADARSRTQGRR